MAIITDIIFFAFSLACLAGASFFLVRSLLKIGSFLRLKEFSVAFIIMSIGTSLPELSIGISSALENNPIISLGNVLGSNIVDLTLILGIALLLARSVKIKSRDIKRDIWYVLPIAALPIVLLFDSQLGKLDGVILIAVFLVYMFKLFSERKKEDSGVKNRVSNWEAFGYTLLFVIALFGLIFSAELTVRYGALLAKELGISEFLLALILIAVGTSIPELAFGSSAALQKHGELAVGDMLGAIVVNSTLVLGVTAFISPIYTAISSIVIPISFMLLSIFIFLTFAQSAKKLSWLIGICLIFLYVFFLILQIL